MLRQTTFEDTLSATFSQESAAGLPLSVAPVSPTLNRSGQDLARASRTRRRGSVKATPTPETSGQTSTGLSASAALCERLASKCHQLLVTVGSMEYRQTWKRKVTPAGRWYWEHTARAGLTSDSGSIGWPSPTSSDTTGGKIPPGHANRNNITKLKQVSAVVGWPTPEALNHEGYQVMNGIQYPRIGAVAKTASWNTPRATDGSKGGPNQSGGALPADAATASCSTPKANEKIQSPKAHAKGFYSVADQAAMASGPTSNSSTAPMARRGVLNPALFRWLQAFPASWDHCSPFWKEWELIQSVLSESSATSEAVWQKLAAIALEDFAATETLSALKPLLSS